MTIEQAFKHLIDHWKDQNTEFVTKYRTYKSRFLNASGRQTKKVSEEKMIEILREAGYTVDIKVKIILPKK